MKHDTPLISVIMPCFNCEPHLEKSIQSVLDQTYPNLELIVVNDGSTDGSLNILRNINDQRLKIIDQTNTGVCRARNNGLAVAMGEYIAFLDADDTWNIECLSKLYQALNSSPDAVLSYCGWQNIGLEGGRGRPFVPPDYENQNKIYTLLQSCRWPINTVLTRAQAIHDVGGFDERFLTSEDFFLWLKIATRHPITLFPEVLAFYHHGGNQATSNHLPTAISHWKVQEAFINENPDLFAYISRSKLRKLTLGELLFRGYQCYWKRDLKSARVIFKYVMLHHYGNLRDWKYMLFSLLPLSFQEKLISIRKNR